MQLILAIAMVTMFGGPVIAPALPMVQVALGVETASIGLLMTAFSLPGVVSIPITGVLADRYGRRKVIVPLLMLYGLAGGLSVFAPNFEILLAMRFLSGLGAGSLATLSLILIGDMFANDKDRVAALGYRVAFGQVTNGLFPILGGLLAVISWQVPFLLFFLAVPVGFMALAVLNDEEVGSHSTIKEYLVEVWGGLSNARTSSLLTVAPTLMIINQGVVLTFIPIFLDAAFGVSAAVIGLVISTRVITGSVAAAQMGRLTKLLREEWLIVGSLMVLAVAVGMIPFVTSIWHMMGPTLLIGISTGIGFPAFQSLLVGEAPKEVRAGVMSANGVANRTGQAAGPVLAGILYGLGGTDTVFFGGALFVAAMAIFLCFRFLKHLRAS